MIQKVVRAAVCHLIIFVAILEGATAFIPKAVSFATAAFGGSVSISGMHLLRQ